MRISAKRSTVCKISVDLPMPGSPPNSVILPATRPPPNTRLSSPSRMLMRTSSCVSIFDIETGLDLEADKPPPLAHTEEPTLSPAFFLPTLYSEKVFHSPHAGHLPIHLGLSYPHELQTYAIFSFAIIVLFDHKDRCFHSFFLPLQRKI